VNDIQLFGRKFSPWVLLGLGAGALLLLGGGARATVAYMASAREQKILDSLEPTFRAKVVEFLARAKAAGYRITLTSGRRTMDEQQALYNQGRTAPGNIVTNAKPGESPHNYGQAIDFGFVNPVTGTLSWDNNAPWAAVAQIGKGLGLVWGGDWSSLKDLPHLETTTWQLARTEYRRSGQVIT
jgi:peptidoglycan LD-endopeptidase CwlK